MTLLVFAGHDDPEIWSAAQQLAHAVAGTLVDRLSFDLNDLILVAKHCVVEPAVVLLLADDDETVLVRWARIPTLTEVLRWLREAKSNESTATMDET
jgi:hypothetical protein